MLSSLLFPVVSQRTFLNAFQKVIQPGTKLNRNTDGSNRPPWIQILHDQEKSSERYTNNFVEVQANLGLGRKEEKLKP